MGGYKIVIQSKIRASNCFHAKVYEQDFCFFSDSFRTAIPHRWYF